MARKTYIYRNGEWIDAENYSPEPKVHLITDTIEQTWNPVTNTYETSKSKMRADARAHGFVDIGDDPLPEKKEYQPQGIKETIIRSYNELEERDRR